MWRFGGGDTFLGEQILFYHMFKTNFSVELVIELESGAFSDPL